MTYLCFGSTPAAVEVALRAVPPFTLVGLRGVVGGSLMLAWTAARRPGSLGTAREWAGAALVGLLIISIGGGAGASAQLTLSSGITGVMSATMPLFTSVLGYLLFRERLNLLSISGLLLALAGVAFLVVAGGTGGVSVRGVILSAIGMLAWGVGTVIAPHARLPADPALATAIELLVGGVILIIISSLLGDLQHFRPSQVDHLVLIGAGWLIVSTIAGFAAYSYLLANVPASTASTFAFVNPVVATALGVVLFGEVFTFKSVAATAVVVVGVALIVLNRRDNNIEPAQSPHESSQCPTGGSAM